MQTLPPKAQWSIAPHLEIRVLTCHKVPCSPNAAQNLQTSTDKRTLQLWLKMVVIKCDVCSSLIPPLVRGRNIQCFSKSLWSAYQDLDSRCSHQKWALHSTELQRFITAVRCTVKALTCGKQAAASTLCSLARSPSKRLQRKLVCLSHSSYKFNSNPFFVSIAKISL